MSKDHATQIILVDDDDDLRHALVQGLELEGHRVTAFTKAGDALALLGRDYDGVVVSDIRMPGIDGVALLAKTMDIDPTLPVILITGHGDVPLAVKAMKAGAYEFLEKPFSSMKLAEIVSKAIEKRRLVLENRALRETITGGKDLDDVVIGSSLAMQQLRSEIRAVADADVDVLIHGETGSGKEVVSRAIHRLSGRSAKPFVALNCGALPADIIESELFGHEKGAFTGAHERRIGKLEFADGGTVLLDEIESMPLDLQVKLLRVLEDRSIVRLGSNKNIAIDIRFIAASKADLKSESDAGRFRPDLFFRLNVVSLTLPPLREHIEDVPEIFFQLARQARARYRREIPEITQEVLSELENMQWPGNVRELRNVADRFVLGLHKFNGSASGQKHDNAANSTEPGRLAERLAQFEKSVIHQSLERHGGKIKPVYEELGVSRKTLYDKMKRHGLQSGS